MEGRGSQEIRLHVLWRQVIAGGQPGLVELHRPVGGGEQPAAKPDFHMSGGWDDVDRMARRHDTAGSRWVAAPADAHSRQCTGAGWSLPTCNTRRDGRVAEARS